MKVDTINCKLLNLNPRNETVTRHQVKSAGKVRMSASNGRVGRSVTKP